MLYGRINLTGSCCTMDQDEEEITASVVDWYETTQTRIAQLVAERGLQFLHNLMREANPLIVFGDGSELPLEVTDATIRAIAHDALFQATDPNFVKQYLLHSVRGDGLANKQDKNVMCVVLSSSIEERGRPFRAVAISDLLRARSSSSTQVMQYGDNETKDSSAPRNLMLSLRSYDESLLREPLSMEPVCAAEENCIARSFKDDNGAPLGPFVAYIPPSQDSANPLGMPTQTTRGIVTAKVDKKHLCLLCLRNTVSHCFLTDSLRDHSTPTMLSAFSSVSNVIDVIGEYPQRNVHIFEDGALVAYRPADYAYATKAVNNSRLRGLTQANIAAVMRSTIPHSELCDPRFPPCLIERLKHEEQSQESHDKVVDGVDTNMQCVLSQSERDSTLPQTAYGTGDAKRFKPVNETSDIGVFNGTGF